MNHYTVKKSADKYYVLQNRGGAAVMVINHPDNVLGDIKKFASLDKKMRDIFEKQNSDDITFVNNKCEKITSAEWNNIASNFITAYFKNDEAKVHYASSMSTLSTLIKGNLQAVNDLSQAYQALVKNNTPENQNTYENCRLYYNSGIYSNVNLNAHLNELTGENWNVNSRLTEHKNMLQEIATITQDLPYDVSYDYNPVVSDIKKIGIEYGCVKQAQEKEKETENEMPVKKSLSDVKKSVAKKKGSPEHTDTNTKHNGR